MEKLIKIHIVGIVIGLLVVKYIIQAYFSFVNSKQEKKIEEKPVIHSTIIFSLASVLFICFLFMKNISNVAIALVLLIVGILIGVCGIFNLKNNYNDDLVVYKKGQLVKKGIFSLVRNPIRIGICFETISLALFINSITTIPLLLLYFYLNHRRTLQEEKFLIKAYGSKMLLYFNIVPRYNLCMGLFFYIAHRKNIKNISFRSLL